MRHKACLPAARLISDSEPQAKVPNYLWSWLGNCFHCEETPSSGFLRESFIKRLELINHQTSRCSRLKGDGGSSWEALSTKGELIRKALSYADVICRHIVKISKKMRARSSQAPPSMCTPSFFQLQPRCNTFHQERWTDIRHFLFSLPKKSIQVSVDFPFRSRSDSWRPSGFVDLHAYPLLTSGLLNIQKT